MINKNQISQTIFLKSFGIFLFVFIFSFNITNAEVSVYLKNTSGKLVGRITFTEESFLNSVKVNAFCLYKSLAENISCEQTPATPDKTNPNSQVRIVNSTNQAGTDNNNNFSFLRSAINGVSIRLDSFIGAVAKVLPSTEVKQYVNNTQNSPTPTPTPTPIPTPTPSPTAPVPVVTSNPNPVPAPVPASFSGCAGRAT